MSYVMPPPDAVAFSWADALTYTYPTPNELAFSFADAGPVEHSLLIDNAQSSTLSTNAALWTTGHLSVENATHLLSSDDPYVSMNYTAVIDSTEHANIANGPQLAVNLAAISNSVFVRYWDY